MVLPLWARAHTVENADYLLSAQAGQHERFTGRSRLSVQVWSVCRTRPTARNRDPAHLNFPKHTRNFGDYVDRYLDQPATQWSHAGGWLDRLHSPFVHSDRT